MPLLEPSQKVSPFECQLPSGLGDSPVRGGAPELAPIEAAAPPQRFMIDGGQVAVDCADRLRLLLKA
jgi:hypothetical protein